MKKNLIKVAALVTVIALGLATPVALKMRKNFYNSALQTTSIKEEKPLFLKSTMKVPYEEPLFEEPANAVVLAPADKKLEPEIGKQSADFVLYSLQSRKEGEKIKIVAEYGQNSGQTINAPLDWLYNFEEANRPSVLMDRDETKEYLSGAIYKRYFFVHKDVKTVQVVLDPEERINDNDRRNNRKILPLITDKNRPEGVDLFISRITSRLEKEGLKVFLEIGQSGDSVIDLKDLEVKFFLPYQDHALPFAEAFKGYLNPDDKVSFIAFLPASAQGNKLRAVIDPQNKFNDLNRDNNFREERLAGLKNDYLDWKLEKADGRVLEIEGEKLRKIYLEYRHDGDSPNLSPQLRILNAANNEIVWFEEKISGRLIGIEKDRLSGYEVFLPHREEENDLIVEITDYQGKDDPIPANNQRNLVTKE